MWRSCVRAYPRGVTRLGASRWRTALVLALALLAWSAASESSAEHLVAPSSPADAVKFESALTLFATTSDRPVFSLHTKLGEDREDSGSRPRVFRPSGHPPGCWGVSAPHPRCSPPGQLRRASPVEVRLRPGTHEPRVDRAVLSGPIEGGVMTTGDVVRERALALARSETDRIRLCPSC